MAAVVLLAIAYIVYRILDLMPYVRVESSSTDREEQEKAERLAKAMEDLLRMQGMI